MDVNADVQNPLCLVAFSISASEPRMMVLRNLCGKMLAEAKNDTGDPSPLVHLSLACSPALFAVPGALLVGLGPLAFPKLETLGPSFSVVSFHLKSDWGEPRRSLLFQS